jgi:hypothetical protein
MINTRAGSRRLPVVPVCAGGSGDSAGGRRGSGTSVAPRLAVDGGPPIVTSTTGRVRGSAIVVKPLVAVVVIIITVVIVA